MCQRGIWQLSIILPQQWHMPVRFTTCWWGGVSARWTRDLVFIRAICQWNSSSMLVVNKQWQTTKSRDTTAEWNMITDFSTSALLDFPLFTVTPPNSFSKLSPWEARRLLVGSRVEWFWLCIYSISCILSKSITLHNTTTFLFHYYSFFPFCALWASSIKSLFLIEWLNLHVSSLHWNVW